MMEIKIIMMVEIQVAQLSLVGNEIALHYQAHALLYVEIVY